MVNISNNQNQRVSVSTNNNNSVSASSPKANDVNAGTNANAQLARSWAIGEGLIQGEDYSSKYYAGKAKESEEIATEAISHIGTSVEDAHEYAVSAGSSSISASESETNASIWAEGDDDDVESLGGTHSAKGWAIYIVNNAPTVTVTETSSGALVTATDLQGTTSVEILNGEKGDTGATGQDGFSPIATVTETSSGATVSITDASGTTTANLVNGRDGADGQDGAAATISVGTVTTGAAGSSASVENSGTSSAAVFDFTIPKGDKGDKGDTGSTGATGNDGADGFSPIATVTKSGTTITISITDANGTTSTTLAGVNDIQVNGSSVISGTTGVASITVPTDTGDLTNNAGFIDSTAIANMQTTTNLVTSVSSSSTNSQYPSAKLFYDTCGDIETLINAL